MVIDYNLLKKSMSLVINRNSAYSKNHQTIAHTIDDDPLRQP